MGGQVRPAQNTDVALRQQMTDHIDEQPVCPPLLKGPLNDLGDGRNYSPFIFTAQ